jgi:hypothetical protein
LFIYASKFVCANVTLKEKNGTSTDFTIKCCDVGRLVGKIYQNYFSTESRQPFAVRRVSPTKVYRERAPSIITELLRETQATLIEGVHPLRGDIPTVYAGCRQQSIAVYV